MSEVIDNFKLIEPLLVFRDGDDTFYHLQIIQRKKDIGSAVKKNYHLIRSYFIRSREDLMERKEQIKGLCDFFNARAYINLNPKSFRHCVMKGFDLLATYMESNQCSSLRGFADTLAGKYNDQSGVKRWIVDIDEKNPELVKEINDNINDLMPEPQSQKRVALIPTVHGYHLITTPFDLSMFSRLYPGIDVHKNNPTLLYYKTTDSD